MLPNNVEPLPDDFEICNHYDYHAVVSVQLCELANDGFFDLTRADWDFGPKYSPEQHANLCKKITEHFWWREISLIPPGIWKVEFLRKMNEIMPKYIPLYKLRNEGYDLGSSSEYYKSRNIFSDFPQTKLAGDNQDYASTGNDTEDERINQIEPIELYKKIKDYAYEDIDLLIIAEVEPLLSCLFTVNVNGI